MTAPPRLTLRDRILAWVVTGPVGRVVAFFADLAVYWWKWLASKVSRR
jgi:hypothetical protein